MLDSKDTLTKQQMAPTPVFIPFIRAPTQEAGLLVYQKVWANMHPLVQPFHFVSCSRELCDTTKRPRTHRQDLS